MNGKAVDNEARKKRILWRANHRGIKEMDLILGGFAAACLPRMSADEVDRFELLLDVPDQLFLGWLTGTEPVPATERCALLDEILKFRP